MITDALIFLALLVLVVGVPVAAAYISLRMSETAEQVDGWLDE